MDETLGRHYYCFNLEDNSGEAVALITEFISNGYGKEGYHLYQELSLESYHNGVILSLSNSMLTPKKLRELANQLEQKALEIGYTFD